MHALIFGIIHVNGAILNEGEGLFFVDFGKVSTISATYTFHITQKVS